MGGGAPKEVVLIILEEEPKALISKLQSQHPNFEVRYHAPSKDSKDLEPSVFAEVNILVTLRTWPSSRDAAPHLSVIQLFSAGSNQLVDSHWYKDKDVTITTASGIHGPQIAEWVIMTSLVHRHHYKALYELQKKHEWGKSTPSVQDLVTRRIGVLGYGSIGRQVGRVMQAMGSEIVAYTATPKDTPESRQDKGFIVPGTGDPDGEIPVAWYSGLDKKSLHNFLAQDIDVLLVGVPLTDDTRGFLGKEEFKVLGQNGKTKPFVINIARGPIIKQDDLIEALKDGTLEGAALDVTDPEPLPADSELWDLDNAIITPHVSGGSKDYTERAFQLLDQQLTRREKGEKLLNVVQPKRGY